MPGIGLIGLILAGLFAAAMSTIDSGINGVTSVIVYDWLAGQELPLRVSRILTGLLGVIVIGAAIFVPFIGETVIDIIMVIAGTCLGILLAIYLLGMFTRSANFPGVLVGISVGLAYFLFVLIYTDIPTWWYGAFAMFPTFVIGIIASFFFPKPPETALKDTLLIRTRSQ